VAVQATAVALGALAVGLPLGAIIGRRGWRVIADGLGLSGGALVPLWVLLACVVGVLLVANAAAALPGWRAGRIRPAEALHAE
jgi:hypothetical protein